jgi:hypothetical protein
MMMPWKCSPHIKCRLRSKLESVMVTDLTSSYDLSMGFGTVLTLWYFFFHVLLLVMCSVLYLQIRVQFLNISVVFTFK